MVVVLVDRYRYEIEKVRQDLFYMILNKQCAPIMLRLSFHDAATYCEKTLTGGPNGSIRLSEELELSCNRGLKAAVDLCEEIKLKHPIVSYADIYQLAGVVAVEISGGPTIDFVYGRKDSDECTKEGRLPDDGDDVSALKNKFKRMGLLDQDIVALAGARTLLRAHADRSDYDGPWSSKPPRFDNSYFEELLRKQSEGHLELPLDRALLRNFGFSLSVDLYAKRESSAETYPTFKKKKESNVLAKSIVVGIISATVISAAVLVLRLRAK